METPTTKPQPIRDLLLETRAGMIRNPQTRFWAILFDNLRFRGCDPKKTATATTDGKNLWLNEAYFRSLSPEDRTSLLIHEVGHCALGQIPRARALKDTKGYDHDVINRAMDYALNATLTEAGVSLPQGALFDYQYSNKRFEKIAATLDAQKQKEQKNQPKPKPDPKGDQQAPQKGKGKSKGKGKPQGNPDASGEPGEPNGDPQPNEKPDAEPDPQGPPVDGQVDLGDPDENDTDEQGNPQGAPDPTDNANDWQSKVAEAAQACGKGTPSAFVEAVRQANAPKLNWRDLLKAYVRDSITMDDYNWNRPNRRALSEMRVYLPTCRTERADMFYIVRDTSGSIDEQQLAEFHAALNEVRAEFPEVPIRLFDVDTQIHQDKTLTSGEPLPGIKGRGGTDLGIIFDTLAEEGADPLVLVYFTDLEGPHTQTPPHYPVIWLNWARNRLVAPFGETIQIERDN